MRSKDEMLELILRFARDHDDVRAVVMNGSRVNPNVAEDFFQDYDIVYLVWTVEPYRRNPDVVSYFGEIMILQTPDDMGDPPPKGDGGYAYLMQFLDGVRIDLSFHPLENAERRVQDSLSVVLLDKDNLIGELPPPSDRTYLPSRPTAKAFDDCCNEFWWCNPYVAKGLWRDELTYARYMLDTVLRDELMKMLTWYFGVETGFQRAPGKLGKYLREQLDDELWALLERTYADADPDHSWDALFAMDDLFRIAARAVADAFGFTYPQQNDVNVSRYIEHIRNLPKEATTI
jgi:aminoglycoside 6-adenylyltransferase